MAFGMGDKNDGSKGGIPSYSPPFPTGSSEAVLGKGCKIVGQVSFTGSATVDGILEGELTSDGVLTIGESATIKAKINGADVVVRGTVLGDINATTRLALKKPAKVSGNITAPIISIEEGVLFEGKVTTTQSKAVPASSTEAPKVSLVQK